MRLWAAVELYRLTNDSTYGNWLSSHVNGLSNGVFIRTITFTKTNGWETFSSTSTSITLNAGNGNTIMLKHNTGNTGGVNLDTFRVQ